MAENTTTPATPATPTTGAKAPVQMVSPDNTLAAGDACTTSDGRSGYMVAVGDKLVCQASSQT